MKAVYPRGSSVSDGGNLSLMNRFKKAITGEKWAKSIIEEQAK